MRKLFFTLSFFLAAYQFTFAQYPKEFPGDNAGFGKAYAEFIKTCTRDDCKQVAEKFPATITSGKASTYFFKIKGITQSILVKKAPAYPVFMQFATLLMTLDATKAGGAAIDKNFDILQSIIDKSKPGNLKEFSNYIEYLTNLYSKNALYYTNTNAWQATGDYTVDFKDDKPVFTFSSTDLIGTSTADTLTIKNERGKYYPLENLWVGTNGTITLQRAGFDPTNNFVNFSNHQINFTKSDIVIDSAKFTFKPVLNEVLLGTYIDKLLQARSQEKLYPKFRSYSNNVNFNTFGKEIKFSGGFQLEGTNIYGVGSDTILPRISLSGKDGKEVVRVAAKRIQIKDFKDISIEDASMTILLKDNTISHPFVNFTYYSKTKDIKVYRDVKPLSKQPFTSEYHKMFLYIDELKWNLDSTTMKFSMITLSGDKPAVFESFNYYQPNLENKYKGPSEQGPIDKIYRAYEGSGDRFVDAQGLALDINPGAPFSATQPIFFKLMEDGYINYDPNLRRIEVKEKLVNQALAARGKQDYDFIKFASFKRNLNAILDIKSNILEVYGVEEINMSTKSGVKFIPNNDTVRIGKNRVMTLGGKIVAGKFDFVAKKVDFDYDTYAFNMKNVDSMVIYIPEGNGKPNERGEVKLIRSKSPIQNITGSLHIAAPNNKSGTNNDRKYPFFSSGDTAKVFYDKGQNGDKYNKDKFYYQVFPFELDSLNEIVTENLQLSGQLISGGIFQPIQTGLKLQEDKSFGINVETGSKGYNLFGNKGKYTSDINLNSNGLSGKGLFEFGPAKLYADTAFFFMDSVYAQLDSVRITEDKTANLPQTNINQSSFTWNVKKDSLVISEGKDEKFAMYNGTTIFDGKLILNNKNLYGVGVLSWNRTKLQSDDITFRAKQMDAKKGKLNLTTDDGRSLLASNDVNANFDVDKKVANIELNKSDTIPLESFKYVANPKFLRFDLANNKLTLNAVSPTAKFFLLSTDPSKDSLKFVTAEAELNLNDNSIHFAGINELRLADSKIIPDKGEIFIEQDGTVRTLKNAQVLFNADSSYHTVKDAEITIVGRNEFSGMGNYYFKMNNGSIETVPVAEINVNNPYKGQSVQEGKKGKRVVAEARDMSKIFTFAKTSIPEEANFKLDNKIYYKGKFDFDSKHKDIFLDGAVKIDIASSSSDWIPNVQALDPKKPAISMDSILSQANNLFVGLMLDKSIPEFYPAVLQDKRNPSDASIVTIKGSMAYSKTEPNIIIFGDENAFRSQYSHSSCLKYNENTKQIDAAGEIGFGLKVEPCKITTVGNLSFTPGNQNLEVPADLAIKFMMKDDIANSIINDFVLSDSVATFVGYKRNKSIQRTMSVLTKDTLESNRLIAGLFMGDSMFIPHSFNYNLLFNGTKFYWDAQDASFKSVEKISIAIFGSYVVKRQYNAYVELGYSGESDFVNIYLQNKTGAWLFLKIRHGQMGVASSIPEIYNTIMMQKDADRVYREGKNVVFQFMPADLGLRDNFVARMEDFKERFKGRLINSTGTMNSPSYMPPVYTKPQDVPTPPEKTEAPAEIKPAEIKDDFKAKPKKQFSLTPGLEKTKQVPEDTTAPVEEIQKDTSAVIPQDSITVKPKPKVKTTPKTGTKPKPK
ncbi:MAG: hypothetical protein JWN78_1869 [Bacteroidota bacterium]|nr:hypothetical protein [Bacteroidota bacterium]